MGTRSTIALEFADGTVEQGCGKKKFVDYENYVRCHQYEEFEYILRNVNGKAVWFVADHSDNYVTLEEAFLTEGEYA